MCTSCALDWKASEMRATSVIVHLDAVLNTKMRAKKYTLRLFAYLLCTWSSENIYILSIWKGQAMQ